MRKKILLLILALVLILSACEKKPESLNESQVETNESVRETEESLEETIEETAEEPQIELIKVLSINQEGRVIQVEVPKNPVNVAVLDLATLDTIDALGVGKSIKGLSKATMVDGKEGYYTNVDIANLGTVKEVNYEELAALEPQIIFIGTRLQAEYDKLSQIAPVVFLQITSSEGSAFESISNNVKEIAKIYDLSEDVEETLASYEERLRNIQEQAKGMTALVSLVSSGNISLLTNNARCSIIGLDAGFTNLAADRTTDQHGDAASFETILNLNPDFLFVLDRDKAIEAEGAMLAQEVLNNEIIEKTEAFKNERIIYLNPTSWYLSEGGLGALDTMLSDMERAFRR